MTKDEKIQYLQKVHDKEIKPCKLLPTGKYVPTADAQALYFADDVFTYRLFDKYINPDTGTTASINDLFLQATDMELTEHSRVPAHLREAFEEYLTVWQLEQRYSLSELSVIILGGISSEQLALKQLNNSFGARLDYLTEDEYQEKNNKAFESILSGFRNGKRPVNDEVKLV